jgi:hypothetical protein
VNRAGALLLVVSFALYAGTLDHFFVSDDFLNYERNGFRTVADAFGFFTTQDVDFYRPLPRLHFGFLQGFFLDNPLPWNLIGVLLHGIVAATAAWLAASLLGRENFRAARYVGLFFAVHFVHVEAVVWASSVTTLYVTEFVFLALLLWRRARRLDSVRSRSGAVVAFAAALLSKETAFAFFPLLFLTTWVWPVRLADGRSTSRWPRVVELVPFVVLAGAYVWIWSGLDRGADVSPYRLQLGGHVVKNLAFFVASCFVPLRYWAIQTAWADAAQGGGLPAFVAEILRHPAWWISFVLLGAVVAVSIVRGSRSVRGGFAWIVAAASPFLLLPGSGERFVYLPSFGGCLLLGLGAQRLLRAYRRVPGGHWGARAIVLAGLLVFIAGNVDRQRDWAIASRWTRSIMGRWSYFQSLPAHEPIEFVGIPDRHRSAWVFRNGFPSMTRLYWDGRPYGREGETVFPGAVRRMYVRLDPTSGAVGMTPGGQGP